MSMVRERWRADMSDQRTRGQVLKETAAARDPISLGYNIWSLASDMIAISGDRIDIRGTPF
jgi:hypothetical protein